jgi:hypothetical protein
LASSGLTVRIQAKLWSCIELLRSIDGSAINASILPQTWIMLARVIVGYLGHFLTL